MNKQWCLSFTPLTQAIMNVLGYSAIAEANWKANLAYISEYQPKYTFYGDFSIAEFMQVYGGEKNAIRKTYSEVVKNWGNNIEAITEVALVLNHKIWSFYDKVDSNYLEVGEDKALELGLIYDELLRKVEDFIFKKYAKDSDALNYYYRMTD